MPQATQMDPDVINLAKAIRQTESGGDFNAQGKSGESGAYQWMPATWQRQAQTVLGDSKAPMTPQNQNAVAYVTIKQMKDQGLNPAQIAATWNSGSPTGWENKVGTNAKGVHYDVPAYVKSVTEAYQKLKQGQQVGVDPNNPSSVAAPQAQQGSQQPQQEDMIGKAFDFFLPIAHDIANDIQGKSNKNLLQQAADLGLSALWFAPGLDALAPETAAALEGSGFLGKLASGAISGAALGGAAGGLQSISSGKGIGDVLKGAGMGALGGGAVGAAAAPIASFLGNLPNRMTQGALKLDPETAEYALNTKNIGTVQSLLAQSQSSRSNIGSQIGDVLGQTYGGVLANGTKAAEDAASSFTEGKVTPQMLIENAADLLGPTQSNLVDKYAAGEATLEDINKLKSALDRRVESVYTKMSLPPVKKELGAAFASALRDEVKTAAPETVPLFEQYQKEMTLLKSLKKLAAKNPRNLIGLRDLWAIMAGGGGGAGLLGAPYAIPGAAAAYGIERLSSSPGGQFTLAKGLSGLMPVGQALGRGAIVTGSRLQNQ